MKYTYTRIHNESVGEHGTTTRNLHYMYAYKNIWNGISNGKYKLSLNVSISCIDISGLLGDIFKILYMNTLAYCIMSRYCSIVSIFAKTSLKS